MYIYKNEKNEVITFSENELNIPNLKKVKVDNIPENPTNYLYINGVFKLNEEKIKRNIIAKKLKEIEENYKKAITQPYIYNGNKFETDEKSLDILNKVIVALPDNGSITWRTADNKMVTLTKQDLLIIAQELLQRNQTYFLKRCELKDKLKSLDNLEDIKSFDTSII